MKSSKQLKDTLESLKTKRTNWDSRYQSISDHQLARQDFTTENSTPSAPRDSKIYDGTAMDSWFMLTNAIQSILADVDTKWIYLEAFDTEEITDDEMLWYDMAANELMDIFRDDAARFSTQFNETIGDVCGYGTCGIHTSYDPRIQSLFFSSRPLGELYLDQDQRGVIDTIYRVYKIRNRDAGKIFLEMPTDTANLVKKADQNGEMSWCTTFEPDDESESIMSQTFLVENGSPFRTELLEELPIHVGRWRTDPGQIYGTGPGVIADAFARTLNEVVKDWLIQSQKQVRPPVMVADDGIIQGPSLAPNAINIVSSYFPGSREPITPIDLGGNFQVANEEILRLQNSIRKAYLHDILQITDSKELTAFHVQELVTRSQQWAGPVFSRLKVEIIQPMVQRALKLAIRTGLIPAPPDSIIERGIRIVYISPAQKASEIAQVEATMRAVERNIALAEIYPEILDNYDPDKLARNSHMGFAGDPTVLRSPKAVAEIRDQRAEQQAKEKQVEDMGTMMAVQQAAEGNANVGNVLGKLRQG